DGWLAARRPVHHGRQVRLGVLQLNLAHDIPHMTTVVIYRIAAGGKAEDAGPCGAPLTGICPWHMPVDQAMSAPRHVRLFRNGRNQAVRIPVDFELPGDEAIMHRDGDRLVIEPVRKRGLVALLKSMKPIEGGFPEIEDPLPKREKIF